MTSVKILGTGCDQKSRWLFVERSNRLAGLVLALLSMFVSVSNGKADSASVKLFRTPDAGIQPQAAIDSKGTIHLIYYKGDPGAGDVFYVRQELGAQDFSKPLQVNSRKGSAIAMGTIRGAQLALGKNQRVHVVWNGADGAEKHEGAPMLYTRLNDAGTAFEPERDLITYAAGLDGGSSIAADGQGNVYAAWHARAPGSAEGEAGRAVFVARSTDDGKTFEREKPAISKATGACGCCGMRAFADSSGAVYILYRAASEKVNRDEILLVSRNKGVDFEIVSAQPWNIGTCPMSSASLTEQGKRTLAAWESEGQVYYASVDPKTLNLSKPVAPPGAEKRKHPVAVGNAKGETLFIWTEGTGWQKGGAVAWQLYDGAGQPLAEKGRTDGVPIWSLASAVAKPDGSFVIFY